MVNKGKIKGGRGFSSLPYQEQLETLDLLTGPHVLQSLGSGFFQDLLSQATAQTSLLLYNWSNQPAQLSPADLELLLPAHRQAGWVWFSAVCSPRAAPSSSSSPMPAISEPKFTSLRAKCPPAMHGVGAEVVFGAGGPRMVPRQPLGKCPPSLCTGGCGRGSEVCVPHTTALGHDELSPRHGVILRVLLDV